MARIACACSRGRCWTAPRIARENAVAGRHLGCGCAGSRRWNRASGRESRFDVRSFVGGSRSAVAAGTIGEIPANALASVLLALADGLSLHHRVDPEAFRWENVRIAVEAMLSGLDRALSALPRDRRALARESRSSGCMRAPGGAASLGVLVGLGAGVGAVAFRYLILWFTEAFAGSTRPERGRPRREPACAVARDRLRRRCARGRWPSVRPLDRSLRAGGAWARRPGGHARRRRARRPDQSEGRGGEVVRLRDLYRIGRLGRARGPDRADRLGARIDHRPARPRPAREDCACWSRAARRAGSRPPSTPRSPE